MAQSIEDLESLAEARKLVQDLKDKICSQAKQLLAWRRAYKMQEVFITRLHHQKEDQLKTLSSKLLLFESRLLRKQMDISTMLNHREKIIHRQQRIIEILTNRLIDNGLDPPLSDLTELDTNLLDLESLNDSDSAVVMEDVDSENNFTHMPKFKSGNSDGVTIIRSISDAIDPNLKYTVRRSNCYLRRPEILETVYSVEEDVDNDPDGGNTGSGSNSGGARSPSTTAASNTTEANRRRDVFATSSEKAICSGATAAGGGGGVGVTTTCGGGDVELVDLAGGEERRNGQRQERGRSKDDSAVQGEKSTNQVTTYNRVMSNHRSVTKPKDVKYKRINKAKSKSLEELRGRLKNWVEQGTKFAGLSLEHSHSYA